MSGPGLTRDQVAWIAHLARLELTPDELDAFTPQLEAIVGYVRQLEAVPTDGVEPLAHPLDVSNVFRDDEPRESLPVDVALAASPDRHGPFHRVPAVLE